MNWVSDWEMSDSDIVVYFFWVVRVNDIDSVDECLLSVDCNVCL